MGGELPIVLGQVDTPQEARALLLLGEIEEDLHDPEAVLGEVALPLVDRPVPVLPDVVLAGLGWELLGDEVLGVDAYDQHLLVVRSVEDPDPTTRRQPLLITAQVVVVELARGWDLEALDAHALRIDAAHHVADGPVLSRGIERLENDHDAVRGLSRQPLLILR
jgi:hypothetical protein